MNECDILGVKTYSDPSTYFQEYQDPQRSPMIYAPVSQAVVAQHT